MEISKSWSNADQSESKQQSELEVIKKLVKVESNLRGCRSDCTDLKIINRFIECISCSYDDIFLPYLCKRRAKTHIIKYFTFKWYKSDPKNLRAFCDYSLPLKILQMRMFSQKNLQRSLKYFCQIFTRVTQYICISKSMITNKQLLVLLSACYHISEVCFKECSFSNPVEADYPQKMVKLKSLDLIGNTFSPCGSKIESYKILFCKLKSNSDSEVFEKLYVEDKQLSGLQAQTLKEYANRQRIASEFIFVTNLV
ncbi:unnamed protein product [Moneuplotes crassus]|uniref:Uncharacterized protein n=1 Tax=Euplotes crassus TaxID=5936 RepID=A0AAD2D3L5_EUPCR|nr:unnamed protein product [Moneuplotes crassus]